MIYKVLSLWQPWASLWASGIKQCETRSWSTAYRGELLVHAARNWHPELEPLFAEPLFAAALRKLGHECHPSESLPRGAIIGRVRLATCIRTEHFNPEPTEAVLGDYSSGRFVWCADKWQLFRHPIPMRGQQGLFEVELPEDACESAMSTEC